MNGLGAVPLESGATTGSPTNGLLYPFTCASRRLMSAYLYPGEAAFAQDHRDPVAPSSGHGETPRRF